jgi:hypothetical protein
MCGLWYVFSEIEIMRNFLRHKEVDEEERPASWPETDRSRT